jgi:hypothetical protein
MYQVWLILACWFWRRFQKTFSVFLLFCYYLPLEKGNPIHFPQGWFVPSLVKIGPVDLERPHPIFKFLLFPIWRGPGPLFKNKRPMGHIAHLSNLGLYKNIFSIIKYACHFYMPHLFLGVIFFLTNLPLFYVRMLSCKIQLFWLHSS